MKKTSKIFWGIVLVALGVIFALNALDITDIDVFFDGWWTLFIIIPCLVGLFTDSDKSGNLIGLAIGVAFLLWQQDILDLDIVWKLVLPALIIILGLKLIFGGVFKKKTEKKIKELKSASDKQKSSFALFSGNELNYAGEIFEGGDFTAVFGGIDLDLRSALIEKDCLIESVTVFGGIDIILPEDVNVKIDSTGIFGGTENMVKRARIDGAPTVYIKTTAIFGGVDIK